MSHMIDLQLLVGSAFVKTEDVISLKTKGMVIDRFRRLVQLGSFPSQCEP